MQVVGSYSVHIRDDHEALKRTADLFSDAVSHLVHTALSNWNNLSDTDSSFARLRMMECIIHSSDGFVSPDSFDHKFPKFPSYYRRAAIMQALGIVSAYQSSLKNWEANGSKGEAPKLDSCKHRMPALYRGNTYKPVIDEQTGEVMPYAAKIKVFRNHDWVWDTVRLSKTDVDYLDKRGRSGDISAPVLEKKHGCWKLRFAVTEIVELSAKPVSEQKICAVDLGIRLKELDDLIQGLFESQVKGTLPERQAQRLITQYDEEQLQLESRISELEKPDEIVAPKKADINRFIALVRKYQHITELTDPMLYEFIDKVVVHAPTGGMGRYRSQQVDVYFSFIGNYVVPGTAISEEERIAQIDALYEQKNKDKKKRSAKKAKERTLSLKERAKTDPEAAAEYEAFLESRREAGKRYRAEQKAKKEASPEIQAQLAEKAAKKEAREKLAYYRKITIAELEPFAETDPVAKEVLETRRTKAAAKNRRAKERHKEKLATDPEYVAEFAEKSKKQNEKANKRRAELKKQAETDPDAAAKYEAMKARERADANRRNAEKRARAKVDPEYAAEREAFLKEKSKKDYAYHKAKMDDIKARADTDPEAAAALETEIAAVSAKNRRYRENLKEQAKTDLVAAQKIVDRRIRKNELARKAYAESRAKAAEARKEPVGASA